jgi:di/tricarboxylate transporter
MTSHAPTEIGRANDRGATARGAQRGSTPHASSRDVASRMGVLAALAALALILLLPPVQGLPRSGQVMLGILAFAVIVWMTEALDYAASSIVIGALMVFLLAFAPDPSKPLAIAGMGTNAALGLALSGFAGSAVALVAAACFIAAAMTATALDRRMALLVLSRVEARSNQLVVGTMVAGVLLAFVVSSTTARTAGER